MGVGLVLFWPALFFIDGDTPQAQEYARLKGEFDALEQAAVQKKCGIKTQESPFEQIERQRQEVRQAQNVSQSENR